MPVKTTSNNRNGRVKVRVNGKLVEPREGRTTHLSDKSTSRMMYNIRKMNKKVLKSIQG